MALPCPHCVKSYSNKSNLNRHLKEVHNESRIFNNFKCLEGCDLTFALNAELRDHLQNVHEQKTNKEFLKFNSLNEFNIWLGDIQKSSNSAYIKPTGMVKHKDSVVTYYNCNRSGQARVLNETNRQRMMKIHGSRKIGTACTSQIIMIQDSENIHVTFYKSHYGHSFDVQHLPLTQQERSTLANDLTQGVTMSKILDKYRENIYVEKPERINLVTRKDLHNIKASYSINIQDGVRHKEDAVSVDMWVKECEELDNNPVLFYKPQGIEHLELKKHDFCLIMMNKSQEYMLKTFSNKLVCIDSTHGINNYDFELTTLMVVDNFGEGFPGACLITNRKDSKVFKLFFECIKSKIGVLKAVTFMSDVTNVFYNGWVEVMGPVQMQLFCTWHVDRAWQKQLCKIGNIEKRKQVYQALKVLQQTLDENEFHKLLSNMLELLEEDQETKCFGIYFNQYYANTFKRWAYCYRKNAGVNTNMHLESMHKIIKYLYLNAKKTKRLDKGLHALNTYIRDKVVDQTIKGMRGKNTTHIQNINKRHRFALSSDFKTEKHSEKNNIWSVISNTDPEKHYVVEKKIEVSSPCCQIVCSLCNICFHCYSCTCTDYFIKTTICKHIHYISLHFGNEKKLQRSNCPNQNFPLFKSPVDLPSVLTESIKPFSKPNYIEKTEQELKSLSSKISNVKDQQVLSHVYKMLKNANNLIDCSLQQDTTGHFSGEETKEPPNKKIKKQVSFFSTKKSIKKNKSSLVKPGVGESSEIRDILLNKKELISRSSLEDHNYL